MFKLSEEKKSLLKSKVERFYFKACGVVSVVGTTILSSMPMVSATDVSTGGSATAGVSDAVSVFGQIWTLISSNPVLTIFIGMAVLGGGVGLFSKIFRTVKRG